MWIAELCQNLCSDVSYSKECILGKRKKSEAWCSVKAGQRSWKVLSVPAGDSHFSSYLRVKLWILLKGTRQLLYLYVCFCIRPHSESVDVSHDVWPEEVLIHCYKEADNRRADTQSWPSSGIKCTQWSSLWFSSLVSRILNVCLFQSVMTIHFDGEWCMAVKLQYEELSRGRFNPFSVSKLSTAMLLFFFFLSWLSQSSIGYLMWSQ